MEIPEKHLVIHPANLTTNVATPQHYSCAMESVDDSSRGACVNY